MEELKLKALELGESTIFSASQVVSAMQGMAQAGLSVDEQLKGVGSILDLASVAMISLADATKIAVTPMKEWKLEAKDLGDVTDILTRGATLSNTTILEFGEAMGRVGGIAHEYGVRYY